MYDKSMASLGATAGFGLPVAASDYLWLFLGGFALLAAGLAFLRILPRKRA